MGGISTIALLAGVAWIVYQAKKSLLPDQEGQPTIWDLYPPEEIFLVPRGVLENLEKATEHLKFSIPVSGRRCTNQAAILEMSFGVALRKAIHDIEDPKWPRSTTTDGYTVDDWVLTLVAEDEKWNTPPGGAATEILDANPQRDTKNPYQPPPSKWGGKILTQEKGIRTGAISKDQAKVNQWSPGGKTLEDQLADWDAIDAIQPYRLAADCEYLAVSIWRPAKWPSSTYQAMWGLHASAWMYWSGMPASGFMNALYAMPERENFLDKLGLVDEPYDETVEMIKGRGIPGVSPLWPFFDQAWMLDNTFSVYYLSCAFLASIGVLPIPQGLMVPVPQKKMTSIWEGIGKGALKILPTMAAAACGNVTATIARAGATVYDAMRTHGEEKAKNSDLPWHTAWDPIPVHMSALGLQYPIVDAAKAQLTAKAFYAGQVEGLQTFVRKVDR